MRRCGLAIRAIAASALMLAVLLVTACSSAQTYQIESARIDAQVQTDASVHIVDHRLLTISSADQTVSYHQTYPHLADNQTLSINDVRIASANDDGTVESEWTWLSPVEFNRSWTNGVPADEANALAQQAAYTYDEETGTIKIFFKAPDHAQVMLEIDYTVVNGAQIYKDAADVTFKYVDESAGEDVRNVIYSLSLPVPEGEQATPRSNVYAWGHGPANGSVVNAGATITFSTELVKAGQYAEAHVMFPRAWLSNAVDISSYLFRDESHASWTIGAESNWRDTWRNAAMNDDRISVVLCVLCVFVLIGALAVLVVFRREPRLTGELPHEVLEEAQALHPATETRLFNAGRATDDEFALTILRLRDEGVLEAHATRDGETLQCCLSRVGFGLVENALDSAALDVLEALDLDETLCADDVPARAHKNREAFLGAVGAWRKECDETYAAGQYEDDRARSWAVRLRVTGFLLIVLALIVAATTSCYPACVALMLVGAALFGIAQSMHRFTEKGVAVLAALSEGAPDGDLGVAPGEGPRENGVSDEELSAIVLACIPEAFAAAQQSDNTIITRTRDRLSRLGKKSQ